MKDIYKYKILKEIGLVIQFHQNDLTFEKAKKFKLDIIQDPDFNSRFSFLIDLRKALYNFTEEEIEAYGNFVSEKLKPEGVSVRIAILTDTPEQVVKTTIFTLNKRIDTAHYQIFTTLGKALDWLNIERTKWNLISSEINKMTVAKNSQLSTGAKFMPDKG